MERGVNADPVLAEGRKKVQSQLTVPLWRFVTVELVLYFLCHLTCLYVILFSAGDVGFSQLSGGFLRHYWWPLQKTSFKDPFDVFSSCQWGSSLPSHQVSADFILTLLLVFTSNALFLTLMRRIDVVVADNKRKWDGTDINSSQTTSLANELDGNNGWNSFGLVNCDELLKNSMIATSVILCIVIPTCVLSQPANEVRAIGPVLVLLSIAASLCTLEVHGGLKGLQKLLNGMQVFIVVVLVFLSAEANLFTRRE